MRPLDIKSVQDEITALLLAHPELAEDEILREDMVEGSTSAHDFLRNILRKIGATKALCEGTAEYIGELQERKARFERREHALRGLIGKVMNTADIRKVELPEATISIASGPQKVIGEGIDGLPAECVRVKREPDKIKIKALLKAGKNVFGYFLSNGEAVLHISVK